MSLTMIPDIIAAIVVIALVWVIRAERAKAKQRDEVLWVKAKQRDEVLWAMLKRIDGQLQSLIKDTNAQRGCLYKNIHDQRLKVKDELQKRTDEARGYLRERGYNDV
jgi:hypothetical protein